MTSTGNAGLDELVNAIATRLAEIMQNGQSRLLTVEKAAAYLGMNQKQLRYRIAEGSIPTVREGGRIRIDRGDLDHWISLRKGRG